MKSRLILSPLLADGTSRAAHQKTANWCSKFDNRSGWQRRQPTAIASIPTEIGSLRDFQFSNPHRSQLEYKFLWKTNNISFCRPIRKPLFRQRK
jgi:hypothetical protein